VLIEGEAVDQLYPARWFFYKHETEPTTEVAIRRTVAEDLYIVLAGYEMSDQAASFQVTVNPLVNWIWFGFAVLAWGTGIALLPESAFAYAGATVPEGTATASTLLLVVALSLIGPVAAVAQPLEGALQEANEATPLELDLRRSLVCMCDGPGCGKKLVAECMCVEAVRLRGEIRAWSPRG
jgi:cytochrome c-type biogenesis protein CcmF